MTKEIERTVKVAELKAQLSSYLRAARQGHTVTVCDRDTPVARLVPYVAVDETLTSRPPTRGWGEMKPLAPLDHQVDSLAALREERQSSR
jgi:prevent-host-death family protein